MQATMPYTERQSEEKARILTIILHALLIAALFYKFEKYPAPKPENEGVEVALGLPDKGKGDDKPMSGRSTEERNAPPVETKPVSPPKSEPVVPKQTPPPTPPSKPVTKPTPAPPDKTISTEDAEAIALKKKQQQEKAKADSDEKARKAEEVRVKQQQEAEARKAAQEEAARKKAEADAAAKEKADLEKAKSQYGGAFGNGGGSGRGDNGKTGNQGDPNGDPNSDNLKGISTGSGRIGGGLGGRGVVSTPTITENSQKTGVVVVNVCVDATGKVISAKYTQKGSTTSDAGLRQIAEENARNFKFTASSVDEQCGTITYSFKVK